MQKSNTVIVAIFAFWLFGARAEAVPFWEPGDSQLRHDLELVADYSNSKILITTWPMAIDASFLEPKPDTPDAVRTAMSRIKRKLANNNSVMHEYQAHVKLSAARLQEPVSLRTFDTQPREKAELEFGLEWAGELFAWRLKTQLEWQPQDDKRARIDGSFVGAATGNWAITLGALDRWWGPGWDNSLILSSNARPVPALSISRLENTAFDVPVLNWLGPWNFIALAGQLDSHSTVPNTKFIGFRFCFAPVNGVEVGASRTIQWGGDDRPQDGRSLFDAIIGRSNVGSGGVGEDNSNQLAGFDVRWVSPLFHQNYALYGQLIGEDEAGFLPSLNIGLFGAEWWGGLQGGKSWRLTIEHANTHASFTDESQENVAYEHSTYLSGYRYYNRVLGAAIDSDARSTKMTAMFSANNDVFWSVSIRKTAFNNDNESISYFVPAKATATDFVIDLKSPIYVFHQHVQLGVSKIETPEESAKNKFFGNIEVEYDL